MPTLYPNSGFLISGINLNFVEGVRVGEEPVGDFFDLFGNHGISGKVPDAALSNEVFVEAPALLFFRRVRLMLFWRPDDQVAVGELKQWSGKAGDLVSITGLNFYQITDVEFGGSAAKFYKVNSQQLNVVVPQNALWDVIKVRVLLCEPG